MNLRERLSRLSVKTTFGILRRGFNAGFCPVCEARTLFFKRGDWLRDEYHCIRCVSIPRQRALVRVLQGWAPGWRLCAIHESSPSGPTTRKFRSECPGYVPTQYYPDVPSGTEHLGFRCEDLAAQTFADESFDIVLTQDVLEHLLDPVASLREICRTLKPGGVHVFTVPWYHWQDTRVRTRSTGGRIEHLEEPEYHRSPSDPHGALVVTEWGRDLMDTILLATGMTTTAIRIHDRGMGIEAKFIEVFVSRKPSADASRDSLLARWGDGPRTSDGGRV